MNLSKVLSENEEVIKNTLNSSDVLFYHTFVAKKRRCFIVYISSMISKKDVGDLILKPLAEIEDGDSFDTIKEALSSPETKMVATFDDVIDEIVMGNTILIVDGETQALSFGLKQTQARAITEPPTSAVIKGPREGFVENLETNLNLLRKKIKSRHQKVEYLTVGKYSKTLVAICYVEGVVKEGLVEKIKDKLNSIEIDAVLDSSYVAQFLGEKKYPLFKQVGTTEKPDILTSKILEGRVGIFVDGSPIALTLPHILLEDFQSPEDYYTATYKANLARFIRLFAVIASILLPSIFVAAQLFHLELIPLNFLLTIVNSIQGIPLSPAFEMFFALLIFEILNEASIRMPKYVGMAVSIVGGLVLGETAINAGIISAPTLMIIALSGICIYTVPDLVQTFSFLRVIFLIVAGSIGVYGILISAAVLLVYLASMESFGAPLLAPYSPIIVDDLKDSIFKVPIYKMNERPKVFKSPNKQRKNKE